MPESHRQSWDYPGSPSPPRDKNPRDKNPRDKNPKTRIQGTRIQGTRIQGTRIQGTSVYSYLYNNDAVTSSISKSSPTFKTCKFFTPNCTLIHHTCNYNLYQGTVCYDDGCHLKRYACNPACSCLTVTAGHLSLMNFVIDCMHFKGHTDVWCRQHCDPNELKGLEKVSLLTPLISTSPFEGQAGEQHLFVLFLLM